VLAPRTLVRADGRAWIIDRYFWVSAMKPTMSAAAEDVALACLLARFTPPLVKV